MVRLVNKAEQLGLEVARAPDPAGLQHRGTGAIDLQFLNLTDLLDRPELKLDKTIVRETVRGCRVMVTGAGGTIGSELVRQLAALGPSEIVLLDHAEYNLYAIDMEMRERSEEHTSELQSLMRNSYAVFCLKKKTTRQ